MDRSPEGVHDGEEITVLMKAAIGIAVCTVIIMYGWMGYTLYSGYLEDKVRSYLEEWEASRRNAVASCRLLIPRLLMTAGEGKEERRGEDQVVAGCLMEMGSLALSRSAASELESP